MCRKRHIGIVWGMPAKTIAPGAMVSALDAFGNRNRRRAITGVVDGMDFPVVWVCRDEEWERAHEAGRDPEGVPWPAEDVEPIEE